VVKPGEVDNLKSKRIGVVIPCVSEGNKPSNPPKGDVLFARDHFVEWMWAALELVPGKP
jgi:hypothetical protein